jgi:energy-coupling factor transporter transmembrane protein EcfT
VVPPVGLPGRLASLVAVVATATAADGIRVAGALALALAIAVAIHRRALDVLAAPFLWLFVLLFMLPAAIFGGGEAWRLGPFSLSKEGAALGAEMSARATAIILAVAGFAATVPVTGSAAVLERLGLRGIGFALGVAVNSLPALRSAAATTFQAYRQRGGLSRRPLRGLYAILTTVVTETLRRAEETVAAAYARGFTARGRRSSIPRGRYDLPLALALAALVGLILFGPLG